jgi:hypothetical protein
MKDLRKDVELWLAKRSEGSVHRVEESGVLTTTKPSPVQPTSRVKRPKQVSASVSKPGGGPKKPFCMSYDGVTEADYNAYMIARGAR